MLERQPDTGPRPWPEPDGPGPSCNWCGRTQPGGGLVLGYGPRPPATSYEPDPAALELKAAAPPEPGPEPDLDEEKESRCADETACQRERDSHLVEWRRHQYPWWRPTLRELAVLARQKEQARDLLSCAAAAWEAITAWAVLQDQMAAAADDMVVLSADDGYLELTGTEPFPWAISAQAVDPLWSHTMRAPWNRLHTHGDMMARYGHPVPAAKAAEAVSAAVQHAEPPAGTAIAPQTQPPPAAPVIRPRRRRLSRLR